jgi:hypothetical protein
MYQCLSHWALFYSEMTHSQPSRSDSHRIDSTAESLHCAFRLQPKGLPRRATVAIRLLRASSHRCSKVVGGSTATYSGPCGRVSARERGQGITCSGAALVSIMNLDQHEAHIPEFVTPFPQAHTFVTCYLLLSALAAMEAQPGGLKMNFHWMQSTKYLLVVATGAVALDGVLTTLVVEQQHHQNTITGLASVPPAVPVPVSRVPVSAPPQLTPAPQIAPPTLVTSMPSIIPPPQPAPAAHKRLKSKTVPPRRVDPLPAPLPVLAPLPATPARSAPAVKPGTPPELS